MFDEEMFTPQQLQERAESATKLCNFIANSLENHINKKNWQVAVLARRYLQEEFKKVPSSMHNQVRFPAKMPEEVQYEARHANPENNRPISKETPQDKAPANEQETLSEDEVEARWQYLPGAQKYAEVRKKPIFAPNINLETLNQWSNEKETDQNKFTIAQSEIREASRRIRTSYQKEREMKRLAGLPVVRARKSKHPKIAKEKLFGLDKAAYQKMLAKKKKEAPAERATSVASTSAMTEIATSMQNTQV